MISLSYLISSKWHVLLVSSGNLWCYWKSKVIKFGVPYGLNIKTLKPTLNPDVHFFGPLTYETFIYYNYLKQETETLGFSVKWYNFQISSSFSKFPPPSPPIKKRKKTRDFRIDTPKKSCPCVSTLQKEYITYMPFQIFRIHFLFYHLILVCLG